MLGEIEKEKKKKKKNKFTYIVVLSIRNFKLKLAFSACCLLWSSHFLPSLLNEISSKSK